MPSPKGAMSSSEILFGNNSEKDIMEKALNNYTDNHNKDQAKYDRKPPTPPTPPAPRTIVEGVKINSDETNKIIQADKIAEAVRAHHKFTPELKQEFIEIVIANKMKLLTVTDEEIRFEYNNKEFIIIPI